MKIYCFFLSLLIIACSNPKKTETLEVSNPPIPQTTATTSNVQKLLRTIMGTDEGLLRGVQFGDAIADVKNKEKVETFNVGTGTGSTVLEVIKTFEKVSGKKLPYKIVDRREGDITSAYANTDKANTVLGWKAQSTLEESLASAWKWEVKIRS